MASGSVYGYCKIGRDLRDLRESCGKHRAALEGVWPNRVVVEAALTNAIGKLRRGVGEAAGEMIVTVPKVGYRLVRR